MRYSRLKKAVEAGAFKGATLTQPTNTSPALAALANPESRRLGNAAAAGRTQHARCAAKPRRGAGADALADDDGEEEEKKDTGGLVRLSQRKRQVSTTLSEDADSEMFYPDTSQATLRTKQIKRSDSDVEGEEQDELEEIDSDYKPTASGRRKAQDANVVRSSQSQPHNPGTSTRRKASAKDAAKAAYAVGLASGRYAPTPEDRSGAHLEHAARLRNIGNGANPIASNVRNALAWPTAGMRQLNDRDRQFLARHGQASQPTVSSPLAQNSTFRNLAAISNKRSSVFSRNDTRVAEPTDPIGDDYGKTNEHACPNHTQRPHHAYDAASVFDNFSPPIDTATRFARPSPRNNPMNRPVTKARSATQRNDASVNSNPNIDPQLASSHLFLPPPSSYIRGRQIFPSPHVPRAATAIPESTSTPSQLKTEIVQAHAQPNESNTQPLQIEDTASIETSRPHSTAPSTTASEREIAEMLQGLRRGSVGSKPAIEASVGLVTDDNEMQEGRKAKPGSEGRGSAYPELP